jgi:hypothetical protein
VSAFRAKPTEPAFLTLDSEHEELAALTEQLAGRLERLRHVMGHRLATEGRGLATALRDHVQSPSLLADQVVSFQDRARDLLRGSR